MRFYFRSLSHAKQLAKSLREYFPELKLATAQEWTARLLGYRDFHDLSNEHASSSPSPLDADLDPQARKERGETQVTKLMELAKVDRREAQYLVALLAPTGRPLKKKTREALQQLPPRAMQVADLITAKAFDKVGPAFERLTPGEWTSPLLGALVDLWHRAVAAGEAECTPTHHKVMRFYSRNGAVGAASTAYSYANYLLSLKTRENARLAADYFQVAIDADVEPMLTAAALVNSTAIIRDGLISGVPDWESAIKQYARAADLGMVVAMVNAGNISCWIAKRGHPERYVDAEMWYRRALDFVASGKEPLDKRAGPPLAQTLLSAKSWLVYLHFEGLVKDANRAMALGLAREIEARDTYAADVLDRDMTQSLMAVRSPRSRTPAAHWRAVLQVLGWKFDRDIDTLNFEFEGFTQSAEVLVSHGDGRKIAVVVVDSACLPLQKGLNILLHAAMQLQPLLGETLIVVGRKAIFREVDNRCFTLAITAEKGKVRAASIHLRASSPEKLIAQAQHAFGSSAFDGSINCMVPIAVNVLDERVAVGKYCSPDRMYAGVGGEWRLPYAKEENLRPMGVFIDHEVDVCQVVGFQDHEVLLDVPATA